MAGESGTRAGQAYIVGASMYGGPTDASTHGDLGSCGGHLTGKMAFAELRMGTALGHLPCGTKLLMETVGGHGGQVIAEKLDIGLGGNAVNGHERRVDLWYETAKAMGFSGTGLIRIRRVDGKPIVGPNDKEKAENVKESGPIPEGVVKGAENAVSEIASWTGELGKILAFLGSSAGWLRIGKVVVGSALLLIALDELAKIGGVPAVSPTGIAKNLPQAKVAKTAAKVSKV